MNPNDKPTADRPVAAFVLSLIAGLWMLAMGSMMGWGYMGYGWGGHMAGNGGAANPSAYAWMWQHHRMMHGYWGGGAWSWIGVVAAVLVLIGAFAMYSRPAVARSWGVVILVASAVDLLAGAGGFLAGVLGIIGGVLAITWTPQSP